MLLPSVEVIVAYVLIVSLIAFETLKIYDREREKIIEIIRTCMDEKTANRDDKSSHSQLNGDTFKFLQSYGEGTVLEFASIISKEDLKRLHELEICVQENISPAKNRAFGEGKGLYSGNQVTFLNNYMSRLLPDVDMKITSRIHETLSQLAMASTTGKDSSEASSSVFYHKGKQKKQQELTILQMGKRCVEILKYFPNGELRPHNDDISYYTMSIILESNYTGGDLFVVEGKGMNTKQYQLNPPLLGGAIFRSHLTHGVQPISDGHRKVLVIEYWEHQDGDIHEGRRDYIFTRDFLHIHPATDSIILYAAGILMIYVLYRLLRAFLITLIRGPKGVDQDKDQDNGYHGQKNGRKEHTN